MIFVETTGYNCCVCEQTTADNQGQVTRHCSLLSSTKVPFCQTSFGILSFFCFCFFLKSIKTSVGSDATTPGIYGVMFLEALSTKLYAVIKAFMPLYVSPSVAAGRHGTKLWQCLCVTTCCMCVSMRLGV